jgi:hypothetical protein
VRGPVLSGLPGFGLPPRLLEGGSPLPDRACSPRSAAASRPAHSRSPAPAHSRARARGCRPERAPPAPWPRCSLPSPPLRRRPLRPGLHWSNRQRRRFPQSGPAAGQAWLTDRVWPRPRSSGCSGQRRGGDLEGSRWPLPRRLRPTALRWQPRPPTRPDADPACRPSGGPDGPGPPPVTRPPPPPGRPAPPGLVRPPPPPTGQRPRHTQVAPGLGEGHRPVAARRCRRPGPAGPDPVWGAAA